MVALVCRHWCRYKSNFSDLKELAGQCSVKLLVIISRLLLNLLLFSSLGICVCQFMTNIKVTNIKNTAEKYAMSSPWSWSNSTVSVSHSLSKGRNRIKNTFQHPSQWKALALVEKTVFNKGSWLEQSFLTAGSQGWVAIPEPHPLAKISLSW